jgi:uncharacterized protein (TIGR00661 family)
VDPGQKPPPLRKRPHYPSEWRWTFGLTQSYPHSGGMPGHMKIMLSMLGEGRGHMTQALAVKEIVEKAGHKVICAAMGAGTNRTVPEYFASAMGMPVMKIQTLEFSYRDNRKVDVLRTFAGVLRKAPGYWRGVRALRAMVREHQPDVIINFFEAITGLYALTSRKRPPVIAVAHQFMFGHPDYVRATGARLQQLVMRWLVRMTGAASTRMALSLYEARNLPERRLTVCPPLLRRQLFTLQPNPNGDFVLVYLLNHGYAGQIIEWHKRNPKTVLHCFYDKPDAPPEFRQDDTLTFHRLDGDKFLRMMAECKFVACTAGFESLCEAAYLGKPLFLVPVENHVEQQINALDAVRARIGVADTSFNLDRLAELPDRLDNAVYREWLARAESLLLETLNRVVQETRA